MPSVCYDCKLCYGHPLSWCPGCGRKMLKVKISDEDYSELKRTWKVEGDGDLYEYYLNGIYIGTSYSKAINELVAATKARYSSLFDMFGLKDYNGDGPTPKSVVWTHNDRYIHMGFKLKEDGLEQIHVACYYPRIIFRLKGSNLPIHTTDSWNSKEEDFNRDLL